MLSRSSSAKSKMICRPATTASCPNSLRVTCKVIRGCTDWRGPLWRTPKAASIRRDCGVCHSLSAGTAARHWAVGGGDYPACGAGGEPAQADGPHRTKPGRAPGGRPAGRQSAGCRRTMCHSSGDGAATIRENGAGQSIRCAACAAAARCCGIGRTTPCVFGITRRRTISGWRIRPAFHAASPRLRSTASPRLISQMFRLSVTVRTTTCASVWGKGKTFGTHLPFGLPIQLPPTWTAPFQVIHFRNHSTPLVRRSVVRLDDMGTRIESQNVVSYCGSD